MRNSKLIEPEKSSIHIIAMTANAFEEDRQNALDTGIQKQTGKEVD